jgi:hypothetical protein
LNIAIKKKLIFKKPVVIYRIFISILHSVVIVKFLDFKDIVSVAKKSSDGYQAFLIHEQVKYIIFFKKIFKYLRINSCLIKSLSILIFLKKNNFKPIMNIGVLIKNNEFKSHAWLILDNKILTDRPENFSEYKLINTIE